jgi:hypothetical protein
MMFIRPLLNTPINLGNSRPSQPGGRCTQPTDATEKEIGARNLRLQEGHRRY